MTKNELNNWIMYHEIQRLYRLGFTRARIARYLVLDARTVGKYLKMSENDMEQHLIRSSQKRKILGPYENFVKERLTTYQDTSLAQIHDWLKESFNTLPAVSPKTVYNFVAHVRQKHGIPYMPPSRDYFPVEETPYGIQSQVDFGEYNMRFDNGKKKKVYFFAMVLSRSRMKYIWFQDRPFTSESVVHAHEKAFGFFSGIPKTVVYDQDRTIVVDENLGDIILTSAFKQYTKTRGFDLYFCRKSDPESKGKVENVIQYVKKNFLYNRAYYDLETLNEQAIAWLSRTANHLPHNYTKKPPTDEFMTEQKYLSAFIPLATINEKQMKEYQVRKNNVIAYKGNFYTLPQGTYQGPQTKVLVKVQDNTIYICDIQGKQICSHKVSP
jgi:transposase